MAIRKWKGSGHKFGGKRESFMAMRELPSWLGRPCGIATGMKSDWDDYEVVSPGRAGSSILRSRSAGTFPTYLRFIASELWRDRRGENRIHHLARWTG